MDPTQCLKELLELHARLREFAEQDALDDHLGSGDGAEDIEALLQHIEDLHRWLERGGFLPEQWMKYRTALPAEE
jgi:hypothetical protein